MSLARAATAAVLSLALAGAGTRTQGADILSVLQVGDGRWQPKTHRRWDYAIGVVLGAIERVALARRDTAMLAYVKTNMDRWVRPDGTIEGHLHKEYNIWEMAGVRSCNPAFRA